MYMHQTAELQDTWSKNIDKFTIIVGDFNTPLLLINGTARSPTPIKNQQGYKTVNNTIKQLDLTDIYKIFHPITAEYTFFSNIYGTFDKTDHILGNKTNFNKFKGIEII